MYYVKNKELGKNGIDLVNEELLEEYDMCFLGEYNETLQFVLKTYEYYLTFAYNCNWRGSNGYKIYDDRLDAFRRDYDYSQTLMRVSKGNKACLLKEYHHDVPMGHDVVIVGLTEKEYEQLNNASFEKVQEFADKYRNM